MSDEAPVVVASGKHHLGRAIVLPDSPLLAAAPLGGGGWICTSCSRATGHAHFDWNGPGPLCDECWFAEAEDWLERKKQEDLEEEEHDRECFD